jgi:hypothetical protein
VSRQSLFSGKPLDVNALLTLLIYIRQTLQSAQSFRQYVYDQFDKEPLVGNQGIIVNPHYFYSRRCNIFDIFGKQIMLQAIFLDNPRDIL